MNTQDEQVAIDQDNFPTAHAGGEEDAGGFDNNGGYND